ncbi:MAG: hypothetical protein Q3988_06305 [Gemella sp.]|nr:hypothetical protein [Gemella sp.]
MTNKNLGKDILKNKFKNLAIILTLCILLWVVNHFFIKSNLLEQLAYLVAIFYTIYSFILIAIMNIYAKPNTNKEKEKK